MAADTLPNFPGAESDRYGKGIYIEVNTTFAGIENDPEVEEMAQRAYELLHDRPGSQLVLMTEALDLLHPERPVITRTMADNMQLMCLMGTGVLHAYRMGVYAGNRPLAEVADPDNFQPLEAERSKFASLVTDMELARQKAHGPRGKQIDYDYRYEQVLALSRLERGEVQGLGDMGENFRGRIVLAPEAFPDDRVVEAGLMFRGIRGVVDTIARLRQNAPFKPLRGYQPEQNFAQAMTEIALALKLRYPRVGERLKTLAKANANLPVSVLMTFGVEHEDGLVEAILNADVDAVLRDTPRHYGPLAYLASRIGSIPDISGLELPDAVKLARETVRLEYEIRFAHSPNRVSAWQFYLTEALFYNTRWRDLQRDIPGEIWSTLLPEAVPFSQLELANARQDYQDPVAMEQRVKLVSALNSRGLLKRVIDSSGSKNSDFFSSLKFVWKQSKK